MQVPFVGSGVLGSAVGMDKLAMKSAFAQAGLPQVAYREIRRHEIRPIPVSFLNSVMRLMRCWAILVSLNLPI